MPRRRYPPTPCCPRCFDAASPEYECIDLADAVGKNRGGYTLQTLEERCRRGKCLAKRDGDGTGRWWLLLDNRGLTVDPPSCPHGWPPPLHRQATVSEGNARAKNNK